MAFSLAMRIKRRIATLEEMKANISDTSSERERAYINGRIMSFKMVLLWITQNDDIQFVPSEAEIEEEIWNQEIPAEFDCPGPGGWLKNRVDRNHKFLQHCLAQLK